MRLLCWELGPQALVRLVTPARVEICLCVTDRISQAGWCCRYVRRLVAAAAHLCRVPAGRATECGYCSGGKHG